VEAGGLRLDDVWSPWRFVEARRSIDDLEDAVRRLRHQCIASVATTTSDVSRPLLMLSGGLDSSILAASLAAEGRSFSCLNLATRDNAGDERKFARQVAVHIDRPLGERAMAVSEYDFARIGGVRTPRPVARGYQQLIFETASKVAEELGCDAVIDGGGGDNVFCSLRSVAIAADCLISPDGVHHFRQVRDDLAQLAGASRWKVGWKARRRSWEGARPYKLQVDTRLLAPNAQALTSKATHPWLVPTDSSLPGRGAHIAILIAAQGYVEDGPHGTKLNCIAPLVTQPLIEHCLAIPSWHWFARGNNRAAARMAFEKLLPPQIAWRQGKGNPESFLFSLLEQNKAAMTSYLLDGVLASAGVIDTTALARALRDTERLKGTIYGRILQLVDTESWARGIMAN
jgi:asparagine synthase (glutamine-hydrolysing)